LLNPTFPEDELKLEKTNLIQGLALKRAQPDFLLSERFNKVVSEIIRILLWHNA